MDKLVDFLNQEYGVGDYVVYASSYGHGSKITLAKVLRIIDFEQNVYDYDLPMINGRYQQKTIIQQRLSVQPVKDSRSGWRSNGDAKAVGLTILDNVVRVDASMAEFIEPI